MQQTERTLIILDGYSYLYRYFQYHQEMRVNRRRKNSLPTGVICNTITGFSNIQSVINGKRFPSLGKSLFHVCVYDYEGPAFRDEWMPNLAKLSRQLPEAIQQQIEPIENLCAIHGWKILKIPGLRAIDVIGTLAKIATTNSDTNVLIISGNQDLFQLASDRVTIFDSVSHYERDYDGVLRDFGLPPSLMLDFQVMSSSRVDGKRNISKMTPASSTKLLKKYGSLQCIVENATEIPSPIGQNILKVRDVLTEVRDSLLISTDCDLGHISSTLSFIDTFVLSLVDKAELRKFYLKYGFSRHLEIFDKEEAKLATKNSGARAPVKKTSEIVHDVLDKLKKTQLRDCHPRSVSDFCVYRIKNIKSNRVYFGSTNNPLRRWTEHLRDFEFGTHVNEKLRKDWDEYGFDSFEFKIIKRCASVEEMHAREQSLIIMFWGRSICCNREIAVDVKNKSSMTLLIAEHETYRKLRSVKTQGAITKVKGWGSYLSVHALARDLSLPKARVEAAINVQGQSVDGWFFKSEKMIEGDTRGSDSN
jgi:5'-3' exonuclease